jgi:hypothetical protein
MPLFGMVLFGIIPALSEGRKSYGIPCKFN